LGSRIARKDCAPRRSARRNRRTGADELFARLRAHARREDAILYPWASRNLAEADVRDELSRRASREGYERLLTRLRSIADSVADRD
jgi:hypothetical protein